MGPQSVKALFRRKIVVPLLILLRQGVTPGGLALCVAIGITVGLVPILGISTILCAAIALAFRLNLAAMQIVQGLMAPVQLVLIIPFVRLGEWIMRAGKQPLSIETGMALLKHGVLDAVAALRGAILHAGVAWILVAPIAVFLLYRIFVPIFERVAAKAAVSNFKSSNFTRSST